MRFLIIGVGSIGRRYAQIAGAHGQVAIFDRDINQARACVQQTGATCFETLEEAFVWKPDGTIIATPHTSHVPLAQIAIENCNHVLIEKPIGDTIENAQQLLDQADNLHHSVYVVCNMRFHRGVRGTRDALGNIGRPLFARAHYGSYLPEMRPGTDYRQHYAAIAAQGGGVILDAIHEIDYLCWLFGPPSSVRWDKGTLGDLELNVEDYAIIGLHHAGGVRSEIHLDYLQRAKRRGLEVVGTEGTTVWSSEGKHPEICVVRVFNADRANWEETCVCSDLSADEPYEEMLAQFAAAVSGQATDLQTGAEALASLRAMLTARQAQAETGNAVFV